MVGPAHIGFLAQYMPKRKVPFLKEVAKNSQATFFILSRNTWRHFSGNTLPRKNAIIFPETRAKIVATRFFSFSSGPFASCTLSSGRRGRCWFGPRLDKEAALRPTARCSSRRSRDTCPAFFLSLRSRTFGGSLRLAWRSDIFGHKLRRPFFLCCGDGIRRGDGNRRGDGSLL